MWNTIASNALGGPYDHNPGDRDVADDSDRFEQIKIIVTVFKGKAEVSVSPAPKASNQDSRLAISLERDLRRLLLIRGLAKTKVEPSDKPKQSDDSSPIDV